MYMTKEKLMFEAEVYNKGLKSHPMTEQMLIAVLAGFGEHLQLLQQTPCTTQFPPTYAVNRVEVIDEAGRSYVNWDKKNCVEVQLQDESRTMKVFISRR